MDQDAFWQLVKDPYASFSQADTKALEDVVARFPFFQAAYLLLSRAYQQHSPQQLQGELPALAPRVSSRTQLYRLLHEQKTQAPLQNAELKELDQLIQQSAPLLENTELLAGFQQKEADSAADSDQAGTGDERAILDNFLSNYNQGLFNRKQSKQNPDSRAEQTSDLNREYEVSEANARSCEDHGELKKAVEIYEKLSLQHPENFNYFVEQAERLKFNH